MPTNQFPASFDLHDRNLAEGPTGQLAHQASIAHSERLERKLWSPREGVWSVVGNGLSNQNFIEGPEGLICIDTGESNQEMAWSLAEVRKHTDSPVVGVLYTHFHYIGGTRAVFDAEARKLPKNMVIAYATRNPLGIFALDNKTSEGFEKVLNIPFTRKEEDVHEAQDQVTPEGTDIRRF